MRFSSLLGSLSLVFLFLVSCSSNVIEPEEVEGFMELPYSYSALEPWMDSETVKLHYSRHHRGYAKNLNELLEPFPELSAADADYVLHNLDLFAEDVREEVNFNAGGTSNHDLFWSSMTPDGSIPRGAVLDKIEADFGSFTEFQDEFVDAAVPVMGSGWAWLVLDDGQLEIITTKVHDSPLSMNLTPLLVCDVWEHAYYLKYQNRRRDFVESFFNLIDWDVVNERFEAAVKD